MHLLTATRIDIVGATGSILSTYPTGVDLKSILSRVVGTIWSILMDTVLPVVMGSDILLAGAALLAIAVVIEIFNGLLDLAFYTALAGGIALIGGKLILMAI